MLDGYSEDHADTLHTAQDETADGGDESGQERVEGKSADENAVDELENAGQQDVEEVGVDQLQLLGRLAVVFADELGHYSL